MKKVDKIAEALLNKPSTNSLTSPERTSSKTALPISWISALFQKFQVRYGAKWTSAISGIEEVAVIEWSNELAGITGDQFKHGLDSWSGKWPPSLPEFKSACTGEGLDDFSLGYTPEVYRAGSESRGVKLLSSDARDEKREKFKRGIRDLRASLEKLRSTDAGTESVDEFVSDPVRRKEIEDELKAMGFLE